MMSQTMRRVVRKIKDTSGRPIWAPSYEGGISVGTPDLLLGYPVFLNNDIAVPAASAKSIAFGNFDRYMIRDAMEMTMFRFDDSAYMKLGQVGFLAWARTGGNLLDVNAVKLYVHSAT
jgi:HK97 family phage major capsid protein